MKVPANTFKSSMQNGEVQRGVWLNTASPIVAELAGHAGFDWCLIDGEHGPNGVSGILAQLQALAGTPTDALVRIIAPEVWMIKQVLDLGAQNVMIPMVHDGETATLMARAMQYPPKGIRGMGAAIARASQYGAIPNYVGEAGSELCCIVQAESGEAVDNIADIAGVDGVDCVFIGPSDLSADMGYVGQPGHPEVTKAIAHVIDETRKAGKIAGILAFNPVDAKRFAEMGACLVGVGGDVRVLRQAFSDLLAQVK